MAAHYGTLQIIAAYTNLLWLIVSHYSLLWLILSRYGSLCFIMAASVSLLFLIYTKKEYEINKCKEIISVVGIQQNANWVSFLKEIAHFGQRFCRNLAPL